MSLSQDSQTAQNTDRSMDHGDDETENKPSQPSTGLRLRPRLYEMISKPLIKEIIQNVYGKHLKGKTWKDLDPKITCTNISRDIEYGVVEVYRCIREDNKYKLVVQTMICEYNSQSVNIDALCFWDKNTDGLVYDSYINGYVVCYSQVYFSYLMRHA
ncbi:tctex1 domain-containing protein 2-like [Sipha flava]|jgi:hypothetical protein|uniref:Tctex1 domain-containing protein 2-like n=1 Tax=Sipha flava TaxID=143950 RepID=A0A8B8GRE7_9HEMI|nr:tctex1 domain-containing protein 2-like [Sipha flava]